MTDCNLITFVLCVRQMSEWIAHSKDLFVQSLAEVGQNHQHAVDLQTQHQHFTANCMVSVCGCVCVCLCVCLTLP